MVRAGAAEGRHGIEQTERFFREDDISRSTASN